MTTKDIDEVRCIWCDAKYRYDYDTDEIDGLVFKTIDGPHASIQLHVYMCPKCQGVLAIMTDEPNGASLMIHDTRS